MRCCYGAALDRLRRIGYAFLTAVTQVLDAHGYRRDEWNHRQDGAPGWGDWYFWVSINEDLERPVKAALDTALGYEGLVAED